MTTNWSCFMNGGEKRGRTISIFFHLILWIWTSEPLCNKVLHVLKPDTVSAPGFFLKQKVRCSPSTSYRRHTRNHNPQPVWRPECGAVKPKPATLEPIRERRQKPRALLNRFGLPRRKGSLWVKSHGWNNERGPGKGNMGSDQRLKHEGVRCKAEIVVISSLLNGGKDNWRKPAEISPAPSKARRKKSSDWSNTRPADQIRPAASFYVALAALKTRDHLFLTKLKKNVPCFYFEGFKLNGFML